MSEHDEIPEDVAYAEVTFGDVVHRIPVTPQARRWMEGKEAIAYDNMKAGEPLTMTAG